MAEEAQKAWGAQTIKDRAQVLFAAKRLFEESTERIAEIVSLENGKTLAEAGASVARGIECIEFATSLPQIAAGEVLEVSRGIECKTVRFPLGVVASITPFNFPAMVPLWMAPMAIGMGNAVIIKPSEQTPLTAVEVATAVPGSRGASRYRIGRAWRPGNSGIDLRPSTDTARSDSSVPRLRLRRFTSGARLTVNGCGRWGAPRTTWW